MFLSTCCYGGDHSSVPRGIRCFQWQFHGQITKIQHQMKAFGSSEQSGKPSAARGCPSLTEPFSTLGTDMKAASTPLKCSDIHRHKDTRAHTCTSARTHAHARTSPTHKTQEVCLSRTYRGDRRRKQLSVEGNKKNKS